MTNREWKELIAKEFGVSNTVAKGMLSAMYTARRILSVNRATRREIAERKEREARQIREWEECDRDDWDFFDSYNELLSFNGIMRESEVANADSN